MTDLVLTTNNTQVAIAWSQSTGGASRVYALEFNNTAWQELSGSASGNGISTNPLPADQPSLAYHDNTLNIAWRQRIRGGTNESEIDSARFEAGTWVQADVSKTHGTASQPKLASGGGQLHLVWQEDLRSSARGTRNTIYAMRWNGTAFAEEIVGVSDVADGIIGSGDGLQSLSLAVDSNGKPFVSWSSTDAFSTQIYLRGNLNVANRVIYASATIPLSSFLPPTRCNQGTSSSWTKLRLRLPQFVQPEHSGIQIVGDGAGHTRVTGKLTIAGASNLRISGLNLAVDLKRSIQRD